MRGGRANDRAAIAHIRATLIAVISRRRAPARARPARRGARNPNRRREKGNTGAGGGGQNSPHKEGARRTSASSSLPSSLTLNSENPAGVSKRRSIFRGAGTRTVCESCPVEWRSRNRRRADLARVGGTVPRRFRGFTDPARFAFWEPKKPGLRRLSSLFLFVSLSLKRRSVTSRPACLDLVTILRASSKDRQRATRPS